MAYQAAYWIEELVSDLPGKAVIIADHGQLFGEMGMFSHPFAHIPTSIEVPWLKANKY